MQCCVPSTPISCARTACTSAPARRSRFFEARISFDAPGEEDRIAGITTLSQVDLVASKLLANVDRWADAGVMSRDILDLAMLEPARPIWRAALRKAEDACGEAVPRAVKAARVQLLEDRRRLARCMEALQISVPQALLHQRLQRLGSKVSKV